MASCILYQNAAHTITVLDVPGSLETAQSLHDVTPRQRIVSSKPLDQPYPSVEPKSLKALSNTSITPLQDLILQRHVQLALEEAHESHGGPWCLSRHFQSSSLISPSYKRRKIQHLPLDQEPVQEANSSLTTWEKVLTSTHTAADSQLLTTTSEDRFTVHRNAEINLNSYETLDWGLVYLPPFSTFLCANIGDSVGTFTAAAPKFNLIIMDPPWPNRSARRKQSYTISYCSSDIRALLQSIPINEHLADDGLLAVWVTNKFTFRELLLETEGLFDAWGITLTEEWIWLKVTESGAPTCQIDSKWRKPYETLLIGQKQSVTRKVQGDVKRDVIIGVPDVHSRKPNLRTLFEPRLPPNYQALEIFARNLTAGWWAWGDEVLKFQMEEHWIDDMEESIVNSN